MRKTARSLDHLFTAALFFASAYPTPGLATNDASAAVPDDAKAQIIALAETFSEAARQERAMDFAFSHARPQVFAETARQMELKPASLRMLIRNGYAHSLSLLSVDEHAPIADTSIFGRTETDMWGAVPYRSVVINRKTGAVAAENCSLLFAFGAPDAWDFVSLHSGSTQTQRITLNSLPEDLRRAALTVGAPACPS